MARVLKLDASFQPVGIIDWTEAFRLIFLGKAEVVEVYEDKKVRSTSAEFEMPSVIRLIAGVITRRQKFARFSRENVFIRDGYKCQYCNASGTFDELTLDHVLPASKGGKKTWDNIVTACYHCNHKKADQTLSESGLKLLSKPYQPKWSPKIAVKMRSLDPQAWINYVTY